MDLVPTSLARLFAARRTVAAAAVLMAAAAGCSGGSSAPAAGASASASAASSASPSDSPSASAAAQPTPTSSARSTRELMGLPSAPTGTPLPGYMLIADRDNNRIIVVSPDKKVVWRFPDTGDLAPGQQFRGPDDAFVTPDGQHIITNEEFADTIAIVALSPKPHISWEYGHANQAGSSEGYLSHPDDAYLRPGGLISVADIKNCRVQWIDQSGKVVRSIGRAGDCRHAPPAALSSPNGDTPLPDGGTLVTEIGGWVDRFDAHDKLVWSVRTPTDYPSDAQLLPDGNVLVAGFNTPGRVDIIKPDGTIVWTYRETSGAGALDRPSLAIALPNGTIAVTDDWNHRVVLIDRATKQIVWEYGHNGQPGSAPGYLNKPDGLGLIQ